MMTRDGLRSQLNDVFADHVDRTRLTHSAIAARQTAEKDDIRRFEALKSSLIHPRMLDLSHFFGTQKIACLLLFNDKRLDEKGLVAYRHAISVKVFAKASIADRPQHIPHYTVVWDEINRVVRFFWNTATLLEGGDAGNDPTAQLHEVTADLIEKRLLAFTRMLLR